MSVQEFKQEFKENHPIAYTTARFIARVLLCTLGVIIGHFICRYLLEPFLP